MPEKTPQHWTESLFDSVYALYETAREYQTAHRAAQLAMDSVDFDRRKSHEGRIAIEGRTNAYGRTYTRCPHDHALSVLSRSYREAASEARCRYTEAALLYASGAAWAIRSVQKDEQPPVVSFEVDADGDAVPRAMHIPGLVTYEGGPALDGAYDAVRRCMDADEYAEDLAGRAYVSDHEAGEMFRAGNVADGLADAAFAYGLLAQRAVSFVLLEPRRARERELALARAAAQQQSQPTT
ncbi:hypothetical protein AB0K62_08815 [Streptomyces halstedii]|uniref:hypothetical protein n=1 Tax=Streptomyces halstedii TaxID=1944 RepID=UPI003460FD8A